MMRYGYVFIAAATVLGGFAAASCSSERGGDGGGDGDGAGSSTSDEIQAYCASLCDECDNACEDDDDEADCVKDLEDDVADADGCLREGFIDYLDCLADDGRCESDEEGYYLNDTDCYDDFTNDIGDCGGGEGGAGSVVAAVGVGPSSTSAASTGVGGGGGAASSGATTTTTTTGPGGCEVTGSSPCADVCQCSAGCMASPAEAEGACATCVQAEANATSDCAVAGSFGDCCQNDAACVDYVDCRLAGESGCDASFPAGADRATACVIASCGDCGTP